MTTFNVIELAGLPFIAAAILLQWRPLSNWAVEQPRRLLRNVLSAAYLVTASALGFGAAAGLWVALRLIPNDDSEAPLQVFGVVSLGYAIVATMALAVVLAVTVKDCRRAFGR